MLVTQERQRCCAYERNNRKDQAIVNLTRCKLDGVEVNNHAAIFGSELHLEKQRVNLLLGHFRGYSYHISVKRLCVALVILPSANILSQTFTKT